MNAGRHGASSENNQLIQEFAKILPIAFEKLPQGYGGPPPLRTATNRHGR